MNRKYGWLGALLVLAVTSCGGGDDPGLAGLRGGGTTTPGTTSPGGTTETVVHMGSSSAGAFQENLVGIAVTNLSAGGSTSLTVQLLTADGAPYTESADVTFSSDCQSAGQSEIQDPVVTTTTGTATTTYTSIGCEGTDTITVRTNVNGQQLTATGSLNVEPASLGSIAFISANPQAIGLKGTGAAGIKETSVLQFQVSNDVGGPVSGQEVVFELSTDVGGLSLTPDTAISGADGIVSVTVKSGTIPTAVRVTATVVDTDIATQSSALTVSTAIPDQNSFSISAETLNPEAWIVDNAEVEITILAADRFNNFVPDDTAIVFTTELGAIEAQCLTKDGGCSVTWRSQEPRISVDNNPQDTGRTTIIAHAIGEEAFVDADANGTFDGTSACPAAPPYPVGEDCFIDLPEAWSDDNEDDDRDDPTEPFVDFDSDGIYDGANGQWDGIVCASGGTCAANLGSVRAEIILVMARSSPSIRFFDENDIPLAGTQTLPADVQICIAGAGTFEPVDPTVFPTRGQPMPAGTTIAFSTEVGELSGKADWVVPSTASDTPDCYSYLVKDGQSGEQGAFEVTVTAPGGLTTVAKILMQDSAPPAP